MITHEEVDLDKRGMRVDFRNGLVPRTYTYNPHQENHTTTKIHLIMDPFRMSSLTNYTVLSPFMSTKQIYLSYIWKFLNAHKIVTYLRVLLWTNF